MIGMLRLEITGADIPGTIRRIVECGIDLRDTESDGELKSVLTVKHGDFERIKGICEKYGDTIQVIRRMGWYWPLRNLANRPFFMLGCVLLAILSLYVPSRIFFVRVEGNQTIPTRLILEMADQCGIGFGSSRRAVRSEKMKNALLESLPQLKWAGVNTQGCVAVISVRERAVQNETVVKSAFGHIVALTDGVITECTALRGSLLCRPGQAVAQGEILISGYTDTGLCIRAEQAQGEVYGLTNRKICVMTPVCRYQMSETGAQKKKISLLIGKKRINLWKDSGIWDVTCDRMYEEYYITLPGGFQLPVALIVERYGLRDGSEEEIPEEELRRLLETAGNHYLTDRMLAGTILDADLTFSEHQKWMTMVGKYRCNELIGVMQRLQIGETNGKTS